MVAFPEWVRFAGHRPLGDVTSELVELVLYPGARCSQLNMNYRLRSFPEFVQPGHGFTVCRLAASTVDQ